MNNHGLQNSNTHAIHSHRSVCTIFPTIHQKEVNIVMAKWRGGRQDGDPPHFYYRIQLCCAVICVIVWRA